MADNFDFTSIRQDFDADAPRLVYADWLEEQGQVARGEFVQLQVRLAAADPADATRHDLHRRMAKLLKEHRSEWKAAVNPYVVHADFERGLIESVRVKPKVLVDCAAKLFAAVPALHKLWSRDPLPKRLIGKVAKLPELARLDSLSLAEVIIGGDGLAQLLQSPHLINLRELWLRGTRLDDAAMVALASWQPLAGLTSLNLASNPFTVGLADVLRNASVLTELRLASAALDVPAVLADARPAGLRELDCGWTDWSPRQWRQLGDALPNLSTLSYSTTGLSSEQIAALTDAPWELRKLKLFQAKLDDASLAVLCAGQWRGLQAFESTYNDLTERGWQTFGERQWPALRSLYLDAPPSPKAAAALTSLAPQLESLTLWGRTSNASLTALLAVPWPRLHTLELGHCQLTEAVVPLLGDRDLLPTLRTARLMGATIKGAHLRKLRKVLGWGLNFR